MGTETAHTLDLPLLDTQHFGTLFKQCLTHQLAIALYHKPNDSQHHCLIDLQKGDDLKTADIETLGEGFIFYPFEYAETQPGKFIRADLHLINDDNGFVVNGKKDENLLKFQSILDMAPTDEVDLNHKSNGHVGAKKTLEAVTEQHYKKMVAEAVRQVKSGLFQKVVLARNKKISLPGSFDIYALFQALCHQYPGSFVSVVFTPETGLWIGPRRKYLSSKMKVTFSTPLPWPAPNPMIPLSICRRQVGHKRTSRNRRSSVGTSSTVSRKYDCGSMMKLQPKTIKAGNLLHLKTDYFVNLNQIEFPRLTSVMLNLLHPTSAVCGMPKEPALGFINDWESFQRKYYSGYLGPINMVRSTDIYVNLRCMKLENNQAELFAGAGITSDSNPDKEWLETEWKFGTLMDVIEKIL